MNEELKTTLPKKSKPIIWFLGSLGLITGAAFLLSLLVVIIVGGKSWRSDQMLLLVGTLGGLLVGLIYFFVVWVCCWRNFRRFVFGLVCLVTLIALFYAEEDWRGKHDWEAFKHKWEAKGERFDLMAIVP